MEPQTANEKIDWLMAKVRELESHVKRLDSRYDHAFGSEGSKPQPQNGGTLHLPKRP